MSLWSRFKNVIRPTPQDEEIREELDFHLEIDQMNGNGEREARLRLGNSIRIEEEVREVHTILFLEEAARSIRFSLRTLRKSPAFAVAAILTIAIGIGANTAVFSVVDGVLLRPLAYPEPDRLVSISHTAPGLGGATSDTGLPLSTGMYFTYFRQNRSFENLGVWNVARVSVSGIGQPEQVLGLGVSLGTLEALGVQPKLGRWFSNADQKPTAAPTALLSYGYWKQHFGGDAGAVGRIIKVDSILRQVIGVMPPGFRISDLPAAIIMPMQLPEKRATLAGFNLNALGRLKPGVSIEQARADIGRLLPIWLHSWDSNAKAVEVFSSWHIAPQLRPLRDTIVGNVGDILWVVMGMLGAVMLIACANVANLFLVHVEGRRQELTVRVALGAGRGRLLGQLVVESSVLVGAGALLGLGLAFAGVRLLQWFAPSNLPRLSEIAIDGRAAAFALAITVISTLLLGSIAAWRCGGQMSLRGSSRTASAGPERQNARNVLVVVQVSLALVLLISSGLMIRTFQKMRAVSPGFTGAGGIQTVRLAVPQALEPDEERVTRLEQDIRNRLADIPGVTQVGFASGLPLDGESRGWDSIFAQGQLIPTGSYPPARVFSFISPGFFHSMGTRLVAGRDYTWDDLYGKNKRLILSENLAREFWGSAAAAPGKLVSPRAQGPWYEVIGVVEDVHLAGVNEAAPAVVYWPALFSPWWPSKELASLRSPVFTVRSSRAGTQSLLEEMRRAIWSVSGNVALADTLTMEQVAGRSMARTSFTLVMLAIAGGMALLLGFIGIYGMVAYTAAQRRREVGIRVALGAEPASVKAMFLRHGMLLSAIGCAVGLAGAMLLSRLMKSLLFGVAPLDPLTYAVMPVLLMAATLVACYFPARRAAAANPVETLRAE